MKKQIKAGLHKRNLHRFGYNFKELMKTTPALKNFVGKNQYGNLSIDFSEPKAVKTLNFALLQKYYDIKFWDIPDGFLCPPIPGRADYIHHVADLLGKKSQQRQVRALDIGTGSNLIYPRIGSQVYGWEFVASDIDPKSIKNANKIIDKNPSLKRIETRLQKNKSFISRGIIQQDEKFDLTICNPPFHSSLKEAMAGNHRKTRNLGRNQQKKGHQKTATKSLNFGGQKAELWCPGGERAFLKNMIEESRQFSDQCLWFTTLISKKENVAPCQSLLKKLKAKEVRVIEMTQGQKKTRILAWHFRGKND